MERFYNSVNNVASSSDGLYTTIVRLIGLSPQNMRTKVLSLLCMFVLVGTTNVLQAQDCDLEPNETIACKSVNASLGANCDAALTVGVFAQNNPYPSSSYQIVSVVSDAGVAVEADAAGVFTVTEKGTYGVVIAHICSGNTCASTLIAEDKTKPTITCPDTKLVACDGDLKPVWPDDYPAVDDNCNIDADNIETYSFTDSNVVPGTTTILDPNDPCEGGVYRTWTVVDACGNVSESCGQLIQRSRPDVIDFPADLNLSCNIDSIPSTDPASSGYPTINVDGVDVELDGKVCAYIATYTEISIPTPCSQKIIRSWSIFDWCAGEVFATQDQFITIADDAAPALVCPADATVASSAFGCEGTYEIPTPEVTDGCSATSTIITLSDGSVVAPGTVITINVEETITYVSSDACGNTSASCTQVVNVSDAAAPVAVCDQNTVVSIGNDGLGLVCAHTVNDGSYDNCSTELDISVKRMDAPNNDPFTTCAEFDCADVGEVVLLRFRVSDGTGHGECMVNVVVQDKIGPQISCPPNKTLNCSADFTTEVLGEANFTDNCGQADVTFSDDGALNSCGEGTILRTWTATDEGATSTTCVQVISIFKTAIATFTGNSIAGDDDDIIFPGDVDLDCTAFQNDNSVTDPANAGTPELIGEEDDCAQLFVGHTDQILSNDPTACYKILRTWTVIDDCQYDPANGSTAGFWQHVQLIKVNDETAPIFDNCVDMVVAVDGEDGCFGEVTVTRTAADACSPDLAYTWTVETKDSLTFNGTGSTLTETYDVGTHTVTWNAIDNCGNTSKCSHELKITDAKKPTPVCVVLYTAVMPSAGSVTIWASDFESGSSFDNCSPHDSLNHYVLPADATLPAANDTDISDLPTTVTFGCGQLGFQNVYVFVEDESGSWDYCLTQVFVNDSQSACADGPMARIQGYIETENHDMVEHVDINVTGANTSVTSDDGFFDFLNLAANNSYSVSPSKDINYVNGVTTYDLVLISQHILGVQPLGSPYKIIAADANMSNSVTTLDLVKIQRLILGLDADLAPNTSWRFVDMDYVFADNTNPFASTFPEVISYNNLASNEMNTDFVGVKIGDVNDSAIPNALLGSALRNTNGTLEFNMEDRSLKAGETYEVALTANDFNNVLGFQYTINVENAEILDVVPGTVTSAENFGMNDIVNGNITTSWFSAKSTSLNNDEVLYTINLKANKNTRLSNVLSVSSTITRAEAYNNNADLLNVAFNFTNSTTATNTFELYQNTPNPFKANTAIGFNLPQAGAVTLSIMDVSGKILRQVSDDFANGYNEFTMNNNIEGTGVFYYRIETATDTATKKMIILE